MQRGVLIKLASVCANNVKKTKQENIYGNYNTIFELAGEVFGRGLTKKLPRNGGHPSEIQAFPKGMWLFFFKKKKGHNF